MSLNETLGDLKSRVIASKGEWNLTFGELQDAFDKVANPENWKMPINVCVAIESDRDEAAIREAIRWFTASEPTITPEKYIPGTKRATRYRVLARGYYATIGA
jgi:hypothetical protein